MGDSVQLVTAEDVAELLGVSTAAVYRWARSKTLPSIKVGKIVRFRKDEIDRLLASGSLPPEKEAG